MQIINPPHFEEMLTEIARQDFSGWDFSAIKNRWKEYNTSWDYTALVRERMKKASSMLDMGTGGGELLATLQPYPPKISATEGWKPNIEIARQRLEPLGVKVYAFETSDDLPLPDNSFDLIINRHEEYAIAELKRIMQPGAIFLTQQVGGKNLLALNQALQDGVYFPYADWTLQKAVTELAEAGFQILDTKEEFPDTDFYDIGAVLYYLKAAPWQVEDFSLDKYYDKLAAIHNQIELEGKFTVKSHYFLIEATI